MVRTLRTILGLAIVATVVAALLASPVLAGKGSPPGAWTTLAPVPDTPPPGLVNGSGQVEGMAVGGVGDTIIAAVGLESGINDNNRTRLYNIASDTWTMGTPAPAARCEVAYGELTHGGKLYVAGGRLAGVATNTLWSYDVAGDTWTVLAAMPTARCAAGAAVVGDALYVIGGRTGTQPLSGVALSVVERYDIESDTWSTVASMPAPRSDMAVVTHGGKIYVFGGWNGTATVPTVSVYDPTKDTWTALTSMPQARAVHMAGRVGNLVYVFGGRDPNTTAVSGVNQVYNLVKDTWTTDTPMTAGQAVGETGVYSHGGAIYVVGGAQPAFGTSRNFTQVFRP